MNNISILLPIAIGVIGLLLLIVSIVMYYARTKDEKLMQRFWLGKDILSRGEYILNRVGFGLSIIGIIWLFLVRFILR